MSLATAECSRVDFEERFGFDTRPEDLVCWAIGRFRGWRTVVTTSFGMEGCALVDMLSRTGGEHEVVYLDTMFFFPQTYALIERMKQRYANISFVNRGTRLTPEGQAERYGDELWLRDPDHCCHLRKVAPMQALMEQTDVWLTGIRRTQSPARHGTELIEWDRRYDVLKINPLAYWEREDVWRYVQKHDVPYNELHEEGYPSLGCTHCTKAVPGSVIGEYSRDGRWSELDKTECGLHFGSH